MAEFRVEPQKIKKTAENMEKNCSILQQLYLRIHAISNDIIPDTGTNIIFKSELKNYANDVLEEKNLVKSYSSSLISIAQTYDTTEKDILQYKNRWMLFYGKNNSSWNQLSQESSVLHKDNRNGSIVDILKKSESLGISITSWIPKKDVDIFDYSRDGNGKVLKKEEWVREEDGQYSIPDLTKYAKKDETIAEVSIDAKKEISLAQWDYNGKNVNTSVSLGDTEIHGSASAGFYVYDKDGKAIFAPGVNAAIGASSCAVTGLIAGSVGNDVLGASAEGEASIGKLSANSSFDAAFFDKEGKLNPQLKLSGSAEAIAAEVKGSVTGKILGVTGKLSGSVNFGIGAHADIGMVDGKIKCEIGAAIGVGASAGVEIDTKPLVNAVVSGCTQVWKILIGSYV